MTSHSCQLCLWLVLASALCVWIAVAEKQPETFIVSFPKSGRTWLRLMVGYALNEQYELHADQADILELDPLVRVAKRLRVDAFPVVAVDHAKKDLELVERALWTFPEQFVGARVVLLVRDPRDVFVSNWFEKKWRKMGLEKKEMDENGFTAATAGSKTADCSWIKVGNGLQLYLSKFAWQREPFCNQTTQSCSCFHPDYTIVDFMKEPNGGFDTILEFSAFFWNNRQRMRDFLLVRYEDMHANPKAELRRVLEFLGVAKPSERALDVAVAEASFDSMREKELTGTFGWRLTARNKNDTATFKTREGRVGGYRDHFDVKLLQMMEQQMVAIMPKEFGYAEEDL
jgi:hypothetical protein